MANHGQKRPARTRVRSTSKFPKAEIGSRGADGFDSLVGRVVTIIEGARIRVAEAVNSEMVLAYWLIGREIVQYIQQGSARADYGERVIEGLSVQLQADVGQGYSVRSLRYFRRFYLVYANRTPCTIDSRSQFGTSLVPNCHDEPAGFSSRLSWSHYRALTTVNEAAARAFYEIEAAREGWSVPNLERQIHTQLHLRLLKSRDKEGVLSLARRGQAVERPVDLIKSPVVLDFLGLPDHARLRESDIEGAIIDKLSQFLLELGKGFAFVARQKRLSFDDEVFFVDLVFYNLILKCYMLVDLKLGKLTHQDVGQMDSYVRLFDAEARSAGDRPTIGLILCAEKNEAIARYSVLSEHKRLFAAKYVTCLPTEEELRQELERDRRIAESLVRAKGRRGSTKRASEARKRSRSG